MGRSPFVIAITIAVMSITISLSGCTTGTPAANHTTPTPFAAEPTLRPNIASPGTLPASGHVYLDGWPVDGASIVAFSYNGSDSTGTLTDRNGSYTLNILPDTRYNITAYSAGRKHTILPVYLHSTGVDSELRKDIVDQYDIVLTQGHNSTIAGKTSPGWMLINASRVDGRQSVTNVSNYSGYYSLDVEPGIGYSLSGKDYYEKIRFTRITFNYRNGGPVDTVTVDPDETSLVDMSSMRIPPRY